MDRVRLQVLYSGNVQGVGFRYTVKSLAPGYEVCGTIRNLADGRVELVIEGAREELNAFHQAVMESGLGGLIREAGTNWSPAEGGFRGFQIIG